MVLMDFSKTKSITQSLLVFMSASVYEEDVGFSV